MSFLLNSSASQAIGHKSHGRVSRSPYAAPSPGVNPLWIDLDNTPHVPFFAPIIRELRKRGHSVLVTARDCFQVCELADLLGVGYKRIGRHYGERKILKVAGLCIRAGALAPTVLRARPVLALSHGSRAQLLLCTAMRVPSIVMIDYEFAAGLTLLRPTWIMVPEAIPDTAIRFDRSRIQRYPGIKEDVYVKELPQDGDIRAGLGLSEDDLVVTIRPPASEAHYHNPESDVLFQAVIQHLSARADTRIVLLPRNKRQEDEIRKTWPELLSEGRITIPAHALDGLSLISQSDLVISGGGTMNREAAALGVPVYSIFRGKIGAVDHHLADTGRLVLIERADEIPERVLLQRRLRTPEHPCTHRPHTADTLMHIVDRVEAIADSHLCRKRRTDAIQ